MCLGIPGKIIEIKDKNAVAEILGATREISIELLNDVDIGDYVLIHAGCAIQILDEEEASATIQLFNELKDITNG
jgi:hydrogenase assembly chaperone HypC/HupF